MKKYERIASVILLLVFIVSCNGQDNTDQSKNTINQAAQSESSSPDHDPYFVESKTITSSFGPSGIVRNVMQDSRGDFWLASWEGIIRYDGNSLSTGKANFTNFTNKEGLRRYHVFTVLEDSKGIIWFGTIGAGVYRYDVSAEEAGGELFTNFTTKEGLVHDDVGCIYEDRAGNIWFGTRGGASCYDGKSFKNFTTKEGLTNNDINSIIEDKAGKFWFGTRGDACVYDMSTEQAGGKAFTIFVNKEGMPFENVRSIIEDSRGNIWLGGNDGLWRYDGSTFTNFTTDFVGYIFEDRKGIIWTTSDEDVANTNNWELNRNWVLTRYEEMPLPLNKVTTTKIRPQVGMLFGIYEDTDGNIWFGSVMGVGRYNGTSFNFFREEEAQN